MTIEHEFDVATILVDVQMDIVVTRFNDDSIFKIDTSRMLWNILCYALNMRTRDDEKKHTYYINTFIIYIDKYI